MKEYINILEIRDLCVNVGDKQLIDHLNLVVPDGEVHAILGHNGSGKSTLMMTIMGFSNYEITQGQILYKENDITELDVCERAELGIAISQQRPPTINGVKLRSILEFILRDCKNPEETLMDLAKTANMEQFLDRSINDGLSGGEIKRAELLQLLAIAPEFSMMDEPDSGVDIEALALVGKIMNKIFSPNEVHPVKRKSGLIITHTGNILKYFNIDKAHVMHNGRIGCSGNPTMILDIIGKHGYEECMRCMQQR
jgi:Fe-S cluster assembly ATP-binding protein